MYAEIENPVIADIVLNIRLRNPLMLLGAFGIGKSDMVRQAAMLLTMRMIDIRASQFDAVDFRGLPVPVMEHGTTRWLTPDFLPREGTGVLFLDELTNANISVQAALYQLVLDRRLGDYVLPDGWTIVAAGNRVSDRAAATRLSKALANRFVILNVVVDVARWLAWAAANGIHPAIRAFIQLRKNMLWADAIEGEESQPTPRSVARLSTYLDPQLGLTDTQLRRNVIGNVGSDFAAQFMAFLPMFRTLPSVQAILANPDTAAMPSEPSLAYAVVTALADAVDQSTFAAALTYAKRLANRDGSPMVEMASLMVSDAVARDASLKETRAYIDHAVAKSAR